MKGSHALLRKPTSPELPRVPLKWRIDQASKEVLPVSAAETPPDTINQPSAFLGLLQTLFGAI
jgi:hypothetical protein